jgi:hypothetical protein
MCGRYEAGQKQKIADAFHVSVMRINLVGKGCSTPLFTRFDRDVRSPNQPSQLTRGRGLPSEWNRRTSEAANSSPPKRLKKAYYSAFSLIEEVRNETILSGVAPSRCFSYFHVHLNRCVVCNLYGKHPVSCLQRLQILCPLR